MYNRKSLKIKIFPSGKTKSEIENRKSNENSESVSQSNFDNKFVTKIFLLIIIIMIPLALQESQVSTKTKRVFHFFGYYTKNMINGNFEKKHVLKWLQKSPFTVNWTVTAESWDKL